MAKGTKEHPYKGEVVDVSILLDSKLDNFTITKMTEVYAANEDGRYISSIGLMGKKKVAEAYAKSLDSYGYRTQEVLVLTDGERAFPIIGDSSMRMLDDEKVLAEVKKALRKKITEAEMEILSMPDPSTNGK
ncbi:MAG: hypothetical protein ACD_7C00474G0001 [uncultured bacterium]|nr:MAG: hypothetical protein ACD_7C00474G0001 [uncultured bacterium]KKP68517.1 MAG: hypothetical protein UR66_C0005G0064 [Candidatus Moranbacteria bacterium GW2011_GWE1_35_17]KKP69595.1 MAG: hypothetical protein UR65_C0049G0004 [Candidatus Moranbacteria bacterium GW2011_GWE2_35_164]KKP81801.1 MAG: hypothetical protein UR82_C0051G0007 [Candidatus Moranbacteria bacterium GW2011_GWF1_35_5]KKP82095.1 MAG: hypothetical protein UR83_C0058G0008 [Candidatus Moranbacteria bacterium GW2011_GWF2_35_54]